MNGVLDSCDIANHTSQDINSNSIPDECEEHGGVPYCFGDGSGAACPCGNFSQLGAHRGGLNSTGTGTTLSGTGISSVSRDSLVLQAALMPHQGIRLFFQGSSQNQNGIGSPAHDGLVCAGGSPVIRLGSKPIGSTCSTQLPGPGDPLLSVKGLIPPGGGTRYYQAW